MIAPSADRIFSISDEESFLETARQIFGYQSENNAVMNSFIRGLGRKIPSDAGPEDFIYLPVAMFRTHVVLTGRAEPELVFSSSGTTGSSTSKHYVSDPSVYRRSFTRSFRIFYGEPSDYVFFALLPSYTDREGSSLIYMVNQLIGESGSVSGGFFHGRTEEMLEKVSLAKHSGKKVMIIGVSFALLDLAETYSPDLSGVTVVETGGMKGRRKEITRMELHERLCRGLNVAAINSEYGMTELLSQAWSTGAGRFFTPPWMRIVLRDPHDPLKLFCEPERTGVINVIDLANINSCSFIATDDLGKINNDGSFEVIGRLDNSDIRGCNLLVT